jgi:hypothetical protein
MEDKAHWIKMMRVLIPAMVVFALILGCNLSGRPVSVTISEIGTCADYDTTSHEPIGITQEFAPNSEKIAVYFYTDTNLDTEVTYRWFLENERIVEYKAPLDQGYNFGWIMPEGAFPEGEYRVEILLGQVTLRSTTFRVVSP